MTVYGARALRQLQIGKEGASAHGTAVAATAALTGILTMKEPRSREFPRDEVGALTESIRSIDVAQGPAELAYEGDVTFEQILYFLLMGVKGAVTANRFGAEWTATTEFALGKIAYPATSPGDYMYEATVTGTSDEAEPTWPTVVGDTVVDGSVTWTCRLAGYVWTFTPSLIALPAPDSFTIEHGDNVMAFESEYCMARSLEISGAVNEALRLRADIFGRQMTATSFTPSLDPPSVEAAVMSGAKLYVDDTWAAVGTNELAASLISFAWRLKTGFEPEKMADGTKLFTRHQEKEHLVELDMVFRFHTNSYAERAKWVAATMRAIRLEIVGSQEGASEYYKKLNLDIRCKYTGDGWDMLSERDGADTVAVKLRSEGDVANDDELSVVVQNGIGTLP